MLDYVYDYEPTTVKKARDPQAFVDTFGALKLCFMNLANEVYGQADMGSTQVRFLGQVALSGRISQAELARATGADPALTGRALKGMIERGILRRERSAEDRREYLLELGPKGSDSLARVDGLRAELATRLVRLLDERDLADFERIARKLMDGLAAPAAGEAAPPSPKPPRGTEKAPARAARPPRASKVASRSDSSPRRARAR